MATATENMIVGLDIGTSKVVAIVGQTAADGTLEIVGLGSQPSRGMKKGVVVDIEATVRSIQRAVEEAELMAGDISTRCTPASPAPMCAASTPTASSPFATGKWPRQISTG